MLLELEKPRLPVTLAELPPAKTLSKQPAPSHPDYSSAPTDIPKQGVFDLDRSVVAPASHWKRIGISDRTTVADQMRFAV